MMTTPTERLEEQAELLFNNIAGWEQRTLEYIGARIKKTGKMSYADVQQLNNIAVVKQDMDAITRDLARVTGYNISQLEEMYGNIIDSQHNANKALFDYRKEPFIPFSENAQLQAMVQAYSRTTGETMINLSKTKALGFIDAVGVFKSVHDTLYESLGKASVEVASGTTDFNTAMRKTIEQIGGSGIRVNYGGGITRRLDSVVRQNVLWGAKQVSVRYNEMIGEQLECDGIEIDWHSNPRPSHEFMQGKQYSLNGKKTVKGITYESADAALEALEDYGCLHFKTPIILGVSEPAYDPEELERLNKKNKQPITVDGVSKTGYEWKQTMRQLETEARKSREQLSLAKAAGNKDLERKYRKHIRAIKTKYTEIADATGIKAQPEKMRVFGKTVGKLEDKESIAFFEKNDIMRVRSDEMNKELENQRYGRNKDTLINKTYIESGEYKKKFDNIDENATVQKTLYNKSKEMLKHRSGTKFEDMYWVDSSDGSVVAKEIDGQKERFVEYSSKTRKTIDSYCDKTLIAIHSHPSSMPPSVADFNSCFQNNYKCGYIACHNGKIFAYTANEELSEKLYNMYIEKFIKNGLSEYEAQISAIRKLMNNYKIDFWEVK